MAQVVDETGGEIVSRAIDRPGREPQGVVLHVTQIVGREPADAAQLVDALGEQVEAVGPLEPILRHEAPETRERIAQLRHEPV